MKEKQKRQKTEKFAYWLQREAADSRRLLEESQSAAAALESQLQQIRGDADTIRDTVQRVDLMYAQIDTLVQAFAEEYSISKRLSSNRAAAAAEQQQQQRSSRAVAAAEQQQQQSSSRAVAAAEQQQQQQSSNSSSRAATAAAEQQQQQQGGLRLFRAVWVCVVHAFGPGAASSSSAAAAAAPAAAAAAAAGETRAKASLPQQAADASADVELKGFSVLLEELSSFKRPSLSKGQGVKLVVRCVHTLHAAAAAAAATAAAAAVAAAATELAAV
ncbi:hypothetical protein EPH_0024530 [Eimeria praecox]|uniref:Uncharacterized protein n=1 Tax=Eimeria praecox TaxID=51316 RepID=U6H6W5_9EIME|nr:hypothetical protein EPH_0024530 [Eimeria praecox]